jgi:hypothetical protein
LHLVVLSPVIERPLADLGGRDLPVDDPEGVWGNGRVEHDYPSAARLERGGKNLSALEDEASSRDDSSVSGVGGRVQRVLEAVRLVVPVSLRGCHPPDGGDSQNCNDDAQDHIPTTLHVLCSVIRV